VVAGDPSRCSETIDADTEEAVVLLGATRLHIFAGDPADDRPGGPSRGSAAVIRQGAGGIGIGGFRVGEHAVQDGDRAGGDRVAIGGAGIPRGDGGAVFLFGRWTFATLVAINGLER